MASLQQALSLLQHGQAEQALSMCQTLVQQSPNDLQVQTVLASTHAMLNQVDQAERGFRDLIIKQPDEPSHFQNLAQLLLDTQRFGEASDLLDQAILLWPDRAELYYRRGIALWRTDRLPDAISHFEDAVKHEPGHQGALILQAKLLAELAFYEKAKQLLATHLSMDQLTSPDWLNEIGLIHRRLWQTEQAEAAFQKALMLAPRHHWSAENLIDLYEHAHRLDAAQALLDELANQEVSTPKLTLLQAKIWRRQKKHAQASALLSTMPDLPIRAQADWQFEYGQLLDANEAYPDAFDAFQKANQATLSFWQQQNPKAKAAADQLPWLNAGVKQSDVDNWAPQTLTPQAHEPVFIVGFPRSGTTLLGRILNAHSLGHTLEERSAVRAVNTQLTETFGPYPQVLGQLTAKQQQTLQKCYWETTTQLGGVREGKQTIDKYPLNLIRLPLLARIFPHAKWLFVQRHPCDVVLSCFMQNFRVNGQVVAFYDLANTAKIYDQVMQGWHAQRPLFDINVHTVSYEQMVATPETHLREVADFLAWPWETSLLNHSKQTSDQPLDSPSYAQVAQPIYQHAAFRWQHYDFAFSDILPILQPWIDQLGYTS